MATAASSRIERALGSTAAEAMDRVLERVRRYVQIETPSGFAPGIETLSVLVEHELAQVGAAVEAVDAPGYGRNLVARITGTEPDADALVVLAHIDTVHPVGTLARQPFALRDGRAEGPGVYDMKIGVALIIEALATLRRLGSAPRRPVRFLVTCDEEIGSQTARPLIEEAARGAAVALVPEPSLADGSIKTARKGVTTYRFEIVGRAAHAGVEPEAAISAVTELSHLLPRIMALADHARGTTVNIGVVHAGTASNVVAGDAWGTIDVRSVVPDEAERVHRGLLAFRPVLPSAKLAIHLTESRPPLVRTAGVAALFERARDVAASLGVEIGEGATGGGSDGSLIATYGVATLDGLGPRGGGAHSTDEHVLVDDLPFRVAFLARLLETL